MLFFVIYRHEAKEVMNQWLEEGEKDEEDEEEVGEELGAEEVRPDE